MPVRNVVLDDEVVLALLSGLPSEYETTATLLVGQREALDLDDVSSRLLIAEKLQGLKTDQSNGSQALAAKANRRGNPKFKQQKGDAAEGQKQFKGKCWYCQKPGHREEECR